MNNLNYLIPLVMSVILASCGSSVTVDETKMPTVKPPVDNTTPTDKQDPEDNDDPVTPTVPAAPTLSLSFTATKVFSFSWETVAGATSYKLKEAVTDASGYETTPIFETTDTTATNFDHIVPLYGRVNAKYMLESCNAVGCTDSAEVFTSARVADMVGSIGYLKASNTGEIDDFGYSVSISADGNTLAVGAPFEDSNSRQIDGAQDNDLRSGSGAVYVFTRNGADWEQQAYLKPSNADELDHFGGTVGLSADGTTLAVGAAGEDSDSRTINMGQYDNDAGGAGAVYIFVRTGADSEAQWAQQAYIKANNADGDDTFGESLSLSANGNTLAVGAIGEGSNTTGVDGDKEDNSSGSSGAVYIFSRTDTDWAQQAYIKASNTQGGDEFGKHVSLGKYGNVLAVAAPFEDGDLQENTDTANDDAMEAGAVYVYTRSDGVWSYQAYVKASNAEANDEFGSSISISGDGSTLAVGAVGEDSSATGVNSAHRGTGGGDSGAVYVFIRTGAAWSEQAYLKASNTDASDQFGQSVSLSDDGNTLAVGTPFEDRNSTGINGTQTNRVFAASGAVYTFTRSIGTTTWSQQSYLKASNRDTLDKFGGSVGLSADGETLVVGAVGERSNAKGVNPAQTNNLIDQAGAVYVY